MFPPLASKILTHYTSYNATARRRIIGEKSHGGSKQLSAVSYQFWGKGTGYRFSPVWAENEWGEAASGGTTEEKSFVIKIFFIFIVFYS
jgi:hypothetical protein